MLRAVDLSADQQQHVRDILTAHRTPLAPLVANERLVRRALADKLLGTGAVTSQDIEGLVQQESQAGTALTRERLATALAVHSVLTPEQIQKAATIRASLRDLRAQTRQLLGTQGAD